MIKQLGFVGLRISLSALHHCETLLSSFLIEFSRDDKSELLTMRQVSSAKSLGKQFVELGRSLINNKNNKGPRDEL